MSTIEQPKIGYVGYFLCRAGLEAQMERAQLFSAKHWFELPSEQRIYCCQEMCADALAQAARADGKMRESYLGLAKDWAVLAGRLARLAGQY